MKIARWSLDFYRLAYRDRIVWANAIEDAGVYALLRLESDDGFAGLAEGTVKATWSGVSPASLSAAFRDLIMPAVHGTDLADAQAVHQALAALPENRLAKGMLETACWMLAAARAEQPLWQYWGGTQEVEVSWTLTRRPPGIMAREAAEVASRHGIRAFKVKGGQGMDIDRQALRAIRRAAGDDAVFSVDANSAYGRDEAAAYLRLLSDEGVQAAEDPCPLCPDAHFEALQQSTPLPIIVDRSCTTAADAALFLERGARALSAKPGRVGMTEAMAIGSLARQYGAGVATGIYAESALGTLINLQQAAAVPAKHCAFPAEQTFFLGLTEQIAAQQPVIRQGRIELPAAPGVEGWIDPEHLARYRLRLDA
ncbi:MAG: mandelate racemase/muconate lactonizing enzyme family protein [Pigmentiphaga sp.]|uniref:mandelate racemase/muconate lactonizing enzyme family protein n=1 Tax=Pigmentiphaga sp. TaxID=1977564 RepID=UPI0029A66D5B|nr:mandelate racemase/muconate lactonizing enzyme family protein [Pigmentiphaga sp.]MDX3904614.1 mandelate racemase/muconate lactonizing enzyme family protein [Pigmentiphaga sp.]